MREGKQSIWFCLLFLGIVKSLSGNALYNLTCVTYDWNVNLTCTWNLLPKYQSSDYATKVDLSVRGQKNTAAGCNTTRSLCTWTLGDGSSDNFDLDPYFDIKLCLQLEKRSNGEKMGTKECTNINIQNHVKPYPVLSVGAALQYQNCILVEWEITNREKDRKYRLTLSTDEGEVVQIKDIIYTIDNQTESKANFCNNISHYTKYTISTKQRPIDEDLNETGYWSDSTYVHILTDKSIPSSPPNLPLGGFTHSAVHPDGNMVLTLYWSALPKFFRNGENLSYSLQIESCNKQTQYLKRSETFAQLDVISNCTYNISIWAWNEIGQSRKYSTFYFQERLLKPRDVYLITSGQSENVTVFWSPPKDVLLFPVQSYTIFWCSNVIMKVCKGSLQYKTVDVQMNRKSFSSNIIMEDFPVQLYMFGVSAQRSYKGYNTSSGFEWTDCSVRNPRKVLSPRVSIEGLASENEVEIAWTFNYCDQIFLREANETEYHLRIYIKNEERKMLISENMKKITLDDVYPGEQVCVIMAIMVNGDLHTSSNSECYKQETVQVADHEQFKTLLVATTVGSAVGLIIVIACVSKYLYRRWNIQMDINEPEILRNASQPLVESSLSSGTESGNSTNTPLHSDQGV